MTSSQSYQSSKATVNPPAHHLHRFKNKQKNKVQGGTNTSLLISPWKGRTQMTRYFLCILTSNLTRIRLPGGGIPSGSNRGQTERRRRKDGGRRRWRSESDIIHRFALFIRNEANRKLILILVSCERPRQNLAQLL